MGGELWKPYSDHGDYPVFLSNQVGVNIGVFLYSNGSVYKPTDTGESNGRKRTLRFYDLDPRTMGAFALVNLDTGAVLSPQMDSTKRYEGGSVESLTVSSSATGTTSNGHNSAPRPPGTPYPGTKSANDGITAPGAGAIPIRDPKTGQIISWTIPNAPQVNTQNFGFAKKEFTPIDYVDVDVLGEAKKAGDFNRENIIDNLALAREISRGNFDEAKQRITEANQFNEQTQDARISSIPGAKETLMQGVSTLEAFSKGRLPDPVENEILNNVSRSQQIAQSSKVGGGISSSFGTRINSQLNLSQRLGLQTTALNTSNSFIANAIQNLKGPSQYAQFDPNETSRIAAGIDNQTNVSPGLAIQSAFNKANTQMDVQKYNTSGQDDANYTTQVNEENLKREIAQADLFNQQSQAAWLQNIINATQQSQADAATQSQAEQNANDQQKQKEKESQNSAIQDGISAIGTVAGVVGEVFDVFRGPATSNSGSNQTNKPTTDAGGASSVNTTTSSPSTTVATPAPQVIQTPESPSVPTTSTSGQEISVVDEPLNYTPGPDDVNYNRALIQNYEPNVSSETRQGFRMAGMDVTPSTMINRSTNNSIQDTTRIAAHRAARENVANKNIELSANQIKYKDGEIGYNPNRSNSEITKIQSPVPIGVTLDPLKKPGDKTAKDLKQALQSFNTKSKEDRPIYSKKNLDGLVSKITEDKYITLDPKRNIEESTMTAEGIYSIMNETPVSFEMPIGDDGKLITDIEYYLTDILD